MITTVDDQVSGYLRLENLTKFYGDSKVVDGIDVSVDKGELIALLGPSGCGKTTTLQMIAGFIDVDEGGIFIGGRQVDKLPSRVRGTTMVFQDYALFPHMTVNENVAFGLRMRKVGRGERDRRVADALELVQLKGVDTKYPAELSGGMKQRVALARAIVVEPQILLLDEPLSNLDAKLRKQLRVSIRELHDRIGITTVFVTHDIEEAFYLANRVVIVNAGHLEQFDTPMNIYSHPASRFVADFVGHTNMVAGELRPDRDGQSRFVASGFDVKLNFPTSEVRQGFYSIPPHRLRLSPSDEPPAADNVLAGTLAMSAYLGSAYNFLVDAGDRRFQVDLVANGGMEGINLHKGSAVWLSWDSSDGNYVDE